eukprot:Plantae.Rhodophyta-Hildenbrandia_rubra.ctg1404.p1 GENE.Plantae.Rhodophyta-Hildenbrandia_rubra.ctg1404~~Plantae.Rhodophyta-Hildenbrandia_rubra.ctg1404.p1  ORF type:complete len:1176 (-),score=145.65 Plantae.Rhodophyta-Hildenbrandia_rubra.ctg1404:3133-6510(-)
MERHCSAAAGEALEGSLTRSVADLTLSDEHVLAAVSSGIRVHTRGGVCSLSMRADGLRDTRSLSLNPYEPSQVAAGGSAPVLAIADIAAERIIRQCSLRGRTSSIVTNSSWVVDFSPIVVFTTNTGRISLCDPSSLREVAAIAAYMGPVTSLSTKGYLVATTGFSSTRNSLSYLDPLIKLYDIRTMNELPAVPFTSCNAGCDPPSSCQCILSPPFLTCFDSWTETNITSSPTLWGLSMDGVLQCFDVSTAEALAINPNIITPVSSQIHLDAQFDTFTSFSVSPGGLIIMGDTGGFIHQWTASSDPQINLSSDPVLGPNKMTSDPAHLLRGFSQLVLSSKEGFSLPLQGSQGSSAFNNTLFSNSDGPEFALNGIQDEPYMPPTIPKVLLEKAKFHDGVAHVAAPLGMIPNCVLNTGDTTYDPTSRMFIDGRYKNPGTLEGFGTERSSRTGRQSKHGKPNRASRSSWSNRWMPPEEYVERAEYTEMDLVAYESWEGFDFLRWNKSGDLGFCGLENGLPNTYVNPLIQALYFSPPFRYTIADHKCDRGNCIACELNFLFHMLKLGGAGAAVETGNFTRTFMTTANAAALGLLEGATEEGSLRSRIEACTRFLLEEFGKDLGSDIFGSDVASSGKFQSNGVEWNRSSIFYLHQLNYSAIESSPGKDIPFVQLLEKSLRTKLENTKAYSKHTGKFEAMKHRRRLVSLPNVMMIGSNSSATGFEAFWSRDGTRVLPTALHVETGGMDKDELDVSEIPAGSLGFDVNEESTNPLDAKITQFAHDTGDHCANYDLSFVVCHVVPNEDQKWRRNQDGHLIVYIRIPLEYKSKNPGAPEWWCFNDFKISPCTGFDEVSLFHKTWRMPCLFGYVRRDINARLSRIPSSPKLLSNPRNVLSPSNNGALGLQPNEALPGRKTVVAIDCEFVCTAREEADIHGDGTYTLLTPRRFALARVSVLRGSGPNKGQSLINDYVSVKEEVVDYLTRYSGIKDGDLHPRTSPFRVVSPKTVYVKLRALVDAGCRFVGHGLKTDFRIINFVVPSSQIVDTVTLYRIPGKRLLSLRFLVGALLGDEIQGFTHDSIEDSKAALGLYDVYLMLMDKDIFMRTLNALYEYGSQHGWAYDAKEPFVIPESK